MLFDVFEEEKERREIHRFFCDCFSAEHVLEIAKTKYNHNSSAPIETIEISYFAGGRCGRNLWERIRMAFALIFKKDAPSWSEFIVRPSDREEISNLLK